jgi:Rad51
MSTVIYRTNINFFTAYNYLIDKLNFTINNKPIELQYGDKVCLVNLDDMISDIAVRGLLPKKSGGIESQNVIIVTSNNNFDFYSCINIAKKKYGMDINKVLDRVLIARVFTIYQLAQKIIYELPILIEKFNSKIVMISDSFLSNSKEYHHHYHQQINKEEKDWLLNQIIKSIKRITNSIVIIFSSAALPNFTNYTK